MISSIANLVHELPNDLRPRILGNKEINGKSQIWVKTQPSAQSPFQKLNFGNSSQKCRKNRYQAVLFLSSFTGSLYPVPNTLSKIAIVSWVQCQAKKVSKSLDYYVQPNAENVPSYRKITNTDWKTKKTLLGTLDVKSMYINMPYHEGIEVAKEALHKVPEKPVATRS